jgi:hypothetical protein
MNRAARAALWAVAAAALAAVALTYFDPHLMLDLATRVWTCF